MPLKLSIGLSRKVGLPDFGSLGASCQIDLELESALLFQDPVALGDRTRRAYAACAEAVDDALKRHRPSHLNERHHDHRAAADRWGPIHRNGVLAATAKQLAFARQLAQEIAHLGESGLAALVQEQWGRPLATLNRSEASQLIDQLQQLVRQQPDRQDLSNDDIRQVGFEDHACEQPAPHSTIAAPNGSPGFLDPNSAR